MDKDKIKIKYLQHKAKGKQASFFYDGDVAILTYKGREVTLVAAGEIRIYNKNQELVYDCKARNSGFPELKHNEPKNDKDLVRIENLGYTWGLNNWFEVIFTYDVINGVKQQDSILGDVAFTYDEGLELAKYYLTDDEFWKQFKKEKR